MKSDLEKLLSTISSCVGVTVEDVKSKSRKHELVTARHMFCYYASVIGKTSYQETADLVNLNYTNIYDVRDKIKKCISCNDGEICSLIEKIDLKLIKMKNTSILIPSSLTKENRYIIGVDLASKQDSIHSVLLYKITSGGTRILSRETISLKDLSKKDKESVDKAFKFLKDLLRK